jgi:drug/metabolite transporter (DMT)-like permease
MRMPLTRRQLVVLVLLTLVWGLNWPVMKLGVSGTPAAPSPFAPLTFRALSMLLGLPVLALALVGLKVPFAVPRGERRELLRLALANMLVWHVVVIVALQQLSSGRSAILGYTMPIFAALWGRLLYGERLGGRHAFGVACAAIGVALLLSSEFSRMAGAPWAAMAVVGAAAVWAWGTHLLRRSRSALPLLAIVFWMTVLTAFLMTGLAVLLERDAWRWPSPTVWLAIAYNAVGVFGFAHAAWFYLARSLPPVAAGISVMMIPVLGTFSGAVLLGEALHWQDFAAMAAIVTSIALVLRRG